MSNSKSRLSETPATLVILVSGRGSNMVSIAKACQSGEINANIALVVSNRPAAPGLNAARELGLKTAVIDHKSFDSREAFDVELGRLLRRHSPDWVVLAGFMRILTADLVNQWSGKILNIHPSLLPAYPGLDTHARAIAAGDPEAGASVHIVTPELDAGPVIAQVHVPIKPGDTVDLLAQRVLAEEHALYVKALQHCVNDNKQCQPATMLL